MDVGEVVGSVVVGLVVGASVGDVPGAVVGRLVSVLPAVVVETGVGVFLTRVIEVQLPASELKEILSVSPGGHTEK